MPEPACSRNRTMRAPASDLMGTSATKRNPPDPPTSTKHRRRKTKTTHHTQPPFLLLDISINLATSSSESTLRGDKGSSTMRGSNNLVPPSTRRYLSLAEAYYHLGPHRGVHQFPGGHDNVPPHFQEPTYPVEPSFMGIIPLFKWIFKSAFTFLAFFSSSIVLYGLVYLVVMPSHHASERLFFDYSGLAKHPAPVLTEPSSSLPSTNIVKRGSNQKNRPPSSSPSRGTGSTIEEQSTIPFTAPWAAADLFSKHSQWEAFHQDVIPSLKSNERILIAGQPYFLELALELPESDINQRAGVFGVQMELQASNGTKLASSIRTARLPHESSWVSVVRKSVWLVPLLLGAVHESRVVVIPSFGHFVESDDLPLVGPISRMRINIHHPLQSTLCTSDIVSI